MNKKGFTLVELLLVVALLSTLGLVFTSKMALYLDNSKESIDKNSAINMVKELKLLALQENNLLSGTTRELKSDEIGYEFPKPQLSGHEIFYIKFIKSDEDKVEIRYDDASGDLIYEEVIRTE